MDLEICKQCRALVLPSVDAGRLCPEVGCQFRPPARESAEPDMPVDGTALVDEPSGRKEILAALFARAGPKRVYGITERGRGGEIPNLKAKRTAGPNPALTAHLVYACIEGDEQWTRLPGALVFTTDPEREAVGDYLFDATTEKPPF